MADNDILDVYGSDEDPYANFDAEDSNASFDSEPARTRYDPCECDNPEKLSGDMRDYVYKHFTHHLKDDVIKDKILKDNPVPNNSIFSAPQLDEFVEELIEDKKAMMFTKIHDGSIKFIQKRIGQVMGPLTKIWKTVEDGVAGKTEESPMGLDELLKLLEKTVMLVGQANVACLYERRLNVLSKVFGDVKKARKSISTNEKSFADGTQGKLLGEEYYKVLDKYSKTKSVREKFRIPWDRPRPESVRDTLTNNAFLVVRTKGKVRGASRARDGPFGRGPPAQRVGARLILLQLGEKVC
ncbi:hypothetical protein FSP39_017854 [Pinctada imbricata]|uniref:Uncharacterized protein n=1 Tax=Pinctada imbricata TaxID=66713 RepID=A0AA89BWR4_PINIB|nr:hypothetical protein FSP39_017854 [Pinctada imbricata]